MNYNIADMYLNLDFNEMNIIDSRPPSPAAQENIQISTNLKPN